MVWGGVGVRLRLNYGLDGLGDRLGCLMQRVRTEKGLVVMVRSLGEIGRCSEPEYRLPLRW